MEDVTLTITPSNKEDFMNSLAGKVVERGLNDEMLLRLIDDVVDNINYDDITERVHENVDYDEIRSDVLREMDYDDVASDILDKIDMYDLARNVLDQIDAEDIVYATNLDQVIDDKVKDAISFAMGDYDNRIDNLNAAVAEANRTIDALINDMTVLRGNQNKSFFRRIFG